MSPAFPSLTPLPQDPDAIEVISPQSSNHAANEATDTIIHSTSTAIKTSKEGESDQTTHVLKKLLKRSKIFLNEIRKGLQLSHYEEDWIRYFMVECLATKRHRLGAAGIDTQGDADLMSCEFASLLDDSFGKKADPSHRTPLMVLETLAGETIYCYEKIDVRWYCDQKNIPSKHQLNFPRQFQDGTFYIPDAKTKFDVIIGKKTIGRLKLHTPAKKRVFAFRSRQPTVDESTADAEQKRADEDRKQEEESMTKQENKRKNEGRAKAEPKAKTGSKPS